MGLVAVTCKLLVWQPQSLHEHQAHSADDRKLVEERFAAEKTRELGTTDGQVPLVTVFTTFVAVNTSTPIGQQKAKIQENTLRSLHLLAPDLKVIVFSADEPIVELGESMGVEVVTNFGTNPFGTPLLKWMFQYVENRTNSPFFGYTNGDILFGSDLLDTLRSVLESVREGTLQKRILVVGRRTNFRMPDKPEEMEKWMITSREHQDEKIRAMRQRGALFLAGAQDYFFIMRDSLRWADIPNLVIGRNGYDNWIMEYAYREKMDRIETTRTVRAIHQTAMDGNWAGNTYRPDKRWNLEFGTWFEHAETTWCNYETRHKDGNIVLLTRPEPVLHRVVSTETLAQRDRERRGDRKRENEKLTKALKGKKAKKEISL